MSGNLNIDQHQAEPNVLSSFRCFASWVPSQLSNPFKHHLSRKSFLTPLRIIPTYDFPLIFSYFCYLSYFLSSSFLFSLPSPPSFLFLTLFALHLSPFRQRTRLISSLYLQLPGAHRPHKRMWWGKNTFSSNRMSCDWLTRSSKQVAEIPGSGPTLWGFKLQFCYF